MLLVLLLAKCAGMVFLALAWLFFVAPVKVAVWLAAVVIRQARAAVP
jgi:hypothetical protein